MNFQADPYLCLDFASFDNDCGVDGPDGFGVNDLVGVSMSGWETLELSSSMLLEACAKFSCCILFTSKPQLDKPTLCADFMIASWCPFISNFSKDCHKSFFSNCLER